MQRGLLVECPTVHWTINFFEARWLAPNWNRSLKSYSCFFMSPSAQPPRVHCVWVFFWTQCWHVMMHGFHYDVEDAGSNCKGRRGGFSPGDFLERQKFNYSTLTHSNLLWYFFLVSRFPLGFPEYSVWGRFWLTPFFLRSYGCILNKPIIVQVHNLDGGMTLHKCQFWNELKIEISRLVSHLSQSCYCW